MTNTANRNPVRELEDLTQTAYLHVDPQAGGYAPAALAAAAAYCATTIQTIDYLAVDDQPVRRHAVWEQGRMLISGIPLVPEIGWDDLDLARWHAARALLFAATDMLDDVLARTPFHAGQLREARSAVHHLVAANHLAGGDLPAGTPANAMPARTVDTEAVPA